LKSNRKLILFTSDFPFGNGETFLETEIMYLADGFDHVHIISSSRSNVQTRSLPVNCSTQRIDLSLNALNKIAALRFLFHPLFWQELKIIRTVYRQQVSMGILATMLISLFQAQRIYTVARKKVLKTSPKDKVYLYSYWCDDAAMGLVMLQPKFDQITTFCRIHRWDVYFEESAVAYLPYRHFITQNISKIFSISLDGIDYAKRVWKTGKDEKFELSRLGINNDRPLKVVERDYFLLVSCSNLIPVKRVHLIAEALQHLTDQRIKWVHIGDGPERNRIEESTKKFPENIEVEFMGRIPNPAIYTYYAEQRPDLFINVSSSEGVPVSIMEAMSFGIPVLATDVGGNGEIVNEGNGKLVSIGVLPLEHAQTISRLINLEHETTALMKKAAFKTWKEQYNAEKNYNEFVQSLVHL
jgi:glycosyltransferase involved in cell wall biosynthesis